MSLPSNLALNSVVHLHTLSVDLAANLLKEPASLDGPSSWHNLHLPAFAAARRQSSNLSFSTTASQPSVRAAAAVSRAATDIGSSSTTTTMRLESAEQHGARKRAARQRAARSCSSVGARSVRADIPTSPVSSDALLGADVLGVDALLRRRAEGAAAAASGSAGAGGGASSSVPSFSSSTSSSARDAHAGHFALHGGESADGGSAHARARHAHATAPPPTMAGVLRKRTRLTRRLVNRHFVLCGDTLYNFRNVQTNPTWRLPLGGAVVGTDLKKRMITVWDSAERRLQLFAGDLDELRCWATALVEASEACLSASSCSTEGADDERWQRD